MLIEAWKVTKAVDIKVLPSLPGSRFPYRLDIQGEWGFLAAKFFFFGGKLNRFFR